MGATFRPLSASGLVLLLAAACGGGGGSEESGPTGAWSSGRTSMLLNGEWEVAEGGMTDSPPADFSARIHVPSLITAAEPPFPDVGVPSPRRDAFWYRRRFIVPEDAPTALLRLHKASYGATVWLNGHNLGSSTNAYTLSEFDARGALRPGAENEIVVRVGADQTKLPAEVPTGWDFEKHRWYPGLWDDVVLVLTGETHAVRAKVEPDLARAAARVLTTVRNLASAPARFDLEQRVRTWKTGDASSPIVHTTEFLGAGEERVFAQDVPIRDLRAWTTDDPFLYVVETTLRDAADPDEVSDRLDTRFGMREVEWRGGAEAGFYLNGKRTPLRGSNITLHRFFEDADAGARPWNELWVRKLLIDYPKEFDWNVFRMTIGRAPNL